MPETRPAVLTVNQPAIPSERMQRLVMDLLGIDSVNRIRSITIDHGGAVVEMYSINEAGKYFVVGEEIAIDRVCIPTET